MIGKFIKEFGFTCYDCIPDLFIKTKEGARSSIVAQEVTVGFDGPEDGSQERYENRKKNVPWKTHLVWWIIHNAISHPFIAFVPCRWSFEFHDFSSRRMHGVK